MPNRIPVDESKAAAFLAEAMPVVVSLGGINPASLARLRGIAHKHGIDAAQMDSLLRQGPAPSAKKTTKREIKLPEKAGPPAASKDRKKPSEKNPAAPVDKARRRKARFAKYAARNIRQAGALWPPVYERLLADARRAGFDPARAMRLIERVTAHLQLPIIPAHEAEHHLRAMARGLCHKKRISVADYAALNETAVKLGVSDGRLQRLVDDAMGAGLPVEPTPTVDTVEKFDKKQPSWWPIALLTVAISALGVAGWLAFFRTSKDQTAGSPKNVENKGATPAIQPGNAHRPPEGPKAPMAIAWGSNELAGLLAQAANTLPADLGSTVHDCGQADPAKRRAAYGRLSRQSDPVVTELLAACFREETDPANASAILNEIPTIPDLEAITPWTPRDLESWLAGAERLARIAHAVRSQPDRFRQATSALEESTGLKADAGDDAEKLVEGARKNTILRAYDWIADLVEESAPKALAFCGQILPRAEEILGTPARRAAETAVARALFDSTAQTPNPETLGKAKAFFIGLAVKDNPDRALLLDLFETRKKSPLHRPLEEALITATGVSPDQGIAAQLPEVRARLDLKPTPPAPADRWATLAEKFRVAEEAAQAPPDNLKGQLAELLRLAHTSSLACALLASSQPRTDRFDALVSQSPAEEFASPAAASQPGGARSWVRPFQESQGNPGANLAIPIPVGEEAKMLRFLTTSSANDRAIAFASICQQVDPASMSWEIADGLARYLLRPNLHNDELVLIQYNIQRVANSANLKLALSERILSAPRTCPGVFLALGEVLGVTPDQSPRWRQSARRSLLESLAYGSGHKTSVLLTSAAEKYVEILKEQGRMLGVPEPDYLLLSSPSSILETNARHLAAGLARDKLPGEDQAFLKMLPHMGPLLAYLKMNDLQATSIQQRQFLRVLELWVCQQRPAQADKAHALSLELARIDKASDNLMARLTSGEKAILRMWMLSRVEAP